MKHLENQENSFLNGKMNPDKENLVSISLERLFLNKCYEAETNKKKYYLL